LVFLGKMEEDISSESMVLIYKIACCDVSKDRIILNIIVGHFLE
jgi:hypothetical protein